MSKPYRKKLKREKEAPVAKRVPRRERIKPKGQRGVIPITLPKPRGPRDTIPTRMPKPVAQRAALPIPLPRPQQRQFARLVADIIKSKTQITLGDKEVDSIGQNIKVTLPSRRELEKARNTNAPISVQLLISAIPITIP